jgi:hypothetical protein
VVTVLVLISLEVSPAAVKYLLNTIKLSDTRGAPYVTLPVDITIPGAGAAASGAPGYTIGGITLPSLCPTGGCFTGPTVRPAQPWLDWETSYA